MEPHNPDIPPFESPPEPAASDSGPSAPPAPPKSSNPIPWATLTLLIVAATVALAIFRYYPTFDPDQPLPFDPERAEFLVRRGDSLAKIAETLVAAGLFSSPEAFSEFVVAQNARGALRPGVYRLKQPVTARELLELLAQGAPIRVTFPEGLRMRQFAERLKTANVIPSTKKFVALAREPDILAELDIPAPTMEGYLWPDTYFFERGDTGEGALRRLAREFQRRTAEHQTRAAPYDLSWPEVVTMASLIQAETQAPEEFPIVASVYYNRLKRGMRLQCDAAVRFAFNIYDRKLLYSDLERAHPYNTYRNAGLPPGPICSPGRLALEAALAPADTDYLYYCTKGDGGHVFAKNYEDHQRNVRQYLR